MRISKTKYYFKGLKKPLKFFVFSDLHLNPETDFSVLSDIEDAAKSAAPDAIFFLGDLVHHIQCLEDQNIAKRLENFLTALSQIAPLYLILGNHDFRSYDSETDLVYAGGITNYWDKIAAHQNITVFRNGPNLVRQDAQNSSDSPKPAVGARPVLELDTPDFYLAGMEQSAEYYGMDYDDGKTRYQRNTFLAEKPKLMREEFAEFLSQLHPPESHDKPRILLLHSARFLGWRKMGRWEKAKDFDLIMSGHLHNMAMPDKPFRATMTAYGLGKRRGHFVCPPVVVFIKSRSRKHFKPACAVLEICSPEP